MPSRRQKSPISVTAASEALTNVWASWPTRFVNVSIFGHHESAKPPLRPEGPPPQMSDVGLEEDHGGVRLELLDAQGRPEAGVAAADDADVGLDVLAQLGRVGCVLARERFLKPKRARRHAANPNEGSADAAVEEEGHVRELVLPDCYVCRLQQRQSLGFGLRTKHVTAGLEPHLEAALAVRSHLLDHGAVLLDDEGSDVSRRFG
jgi:hypothetical protein